MRTPAFRTTYSYDREPLSADHERRIAENCGPLGSPRVQTAFENRLGPTRLIAYPAFALEYSCIDKVPLWVAEHITPAELAGTIPRVNCFFAEPSLPPGQRAELWDFWFSGFQMGHMAAAGNQTVDPDRKLETFTLANIVPQCIPQNLDIWDNLEDAIRECARYTPVYMITGPLFWDPAEDDPGTADGMIQRSYIGPNRVAVPTHIYKIAARQDKSGHWDLIGFVIANDNTFPRPWNLADYIVSVNFIEERTGIDFFSTGGPEIEHAEAIRSEMWSSSYDWLSNSASD